MSVSYSIRTKAGIVTNHPHQACYYQHYSSLSKYDLAEIFVEESHLKYVQHKFTMEDYTEYVRLINTIGIKMSVRKEEKRIVISIPLSENKTVANKIALNAARYLCEGNFTHIVEWFLRFSKEKVIGINLFSKFLIAHYFGQLTNCNHAFVPWYNFPLLLSNSEVKKHVLENDSNVAVGFALPMGKKAMDKKIIQAAFKEPDVTFKQILKVYKQECAKYM